MLAWGVTQFGDWQSQNHQAWAYAFELGFQLAELWSKPWLRIGIDQSSGDPDPNDGDHESFFQVLPTARLYALYPFYNLMNNRDLFAQLILRPAPTVTLTTTAHWLRVSESDDLLYAGGGATSNSVFGYGGTATGGRNGIGTMLDLSLALAGDQVADAQRLLRARFRLWHDRSGVRGQRLELRVRGGDHRLVTGALKFLIGLVLLGTVGWGALVLGYLLPGPAGLTKAIAIAFALGGVGAAVRAAPVLARGRGRCSPPSRCVLVWFDSLAAVQHRSVAARSRAARVRRGERRHPDAAQRAQLQLPLARPTSPRAGRRAPTICRSSPASTCTSRTGARPRSPTRS